MFLDIIYHKNINLVFTEKIKVCIEKMKMDSLANRKACDTVIHPGAKCFRSM